MAGRNPRNVRSEGEHLGRCGGNDRFISGEDGLRASLTFRSQSMFTPEKTADNAIFEGEQPARALVILRKHTRYPHERHCLLPLPRIEVTVVARQLVPRESPGFLRSILEDPIAEKNLAGKMLIAG